MTETFQVNQIQHRQLVNYNYLILHAITSLGTLYKNKFRPSKI